MPERRETDKQTPGGPLPSQQGSGHRQGPGRPGLFLSEGVGTDPARWEEGIRGLWRVSSRAASARRCEEAGRGRAEPTSRIWGTVPCTHTGQVAPFPARLEALQFTRLWVQRTRETCLCEGNHQPQTEPHSGVA